METLREELFRLEPNIELLHELLGFGENAEVRSIGGILIGRREGEPWFKHVIGRPSEDLFHQATILLNQLSMENRAEALRILKGAGIKIGYTFSTIE